MSIWYSLLDLLPVEMLRWDFMKNALLALLLMAPLFGILSTMIVTGRMSFFSDALGHSAFTGIAIGCIAGMSMPLGGGPVQPCFFPAVFFRPQPEQPVGGHPDRCVFQHGGGTGHLRRYPGRRQLHKI